MKKEIIINSTLNEERIAITEDGKLAELFIELPDKEKSIGNIYLGKVTRIVQGINAAFIDIGLKQDAFLHFSDVDESMENLITDEEDAAKTKQNNRGKKKIRGEKSNNIEKNDDTLSEILRKNINQNTNSGIIYQTKKLGKFTINLQPGQNVIVQIVREAYSSKGVKVTTKIGIPGRYTVLLPFDTVIGISKKINIFQERKRLRQLARMVIPKDYGCIIRTAAMNKNDQELLNDFKSLLDIWNDIKEKLTKMDKPGLLYQDLEIATSIIRDLFTNDVKRVIVDSKKSLRKK